MIYVQHGHDSDRGSFVILDPRLASRFCTAFPPGISISRVGLVDAIEMVREFVGRANSS